MIINCDYLSKSFGGVHALSGFSVTINSPGIVAIVGSNGAGKTTLIDLITGYLKPDTGACVLDGHILNGRRPDEIVKLGVSRTFQQLRLANRLTVLENVMLAEPRQRGETLVTAIFGKNGDSDRFFRRRALDTLDFLGLTQMQDASAGELSFGQRKLLALGCCLATQPSIIILDEPVAGVHPLMIETIAKLLIRVKETGTLVIFVEHDLDIVKAIADRVLILSAGRLVADGNAQDVLSRPDTLDLFLG